MTERQSMTDAVEGFYLARIIDFLHRQGILEALRARTGLAAIAAKRRYHLQTLSQLMEFVALRSTLLTAVGRGKAMRFTVAADYAPVSPTAHLLDQYVGAFGPCLADLGALLRDPKSGRRHVDFARHAAAYAGYARAVPQLTALVRAFEIGVLLDVGCGGGQLLADLAKDRPRLKGIGIEQNASAVRRTRRVLAAAGLAARVRIVQGDLLDAGSHLTKRQRDSVDALSAVSVANDFFGPVRGRRIDDFIAGLRRAFPNRIVFLCDYYGRLGAGLGDADGFRRTLMHDVAQLVSAQGVPPKDLAGWRKIYRRTSCRLIEAFERTDDGISWFIHIIQL